MPYADKLTPPDPNDLAAAFALRFHGHKRVHNADELMVEGLRQTPRRALRARRLCRDAANANWPCDGAEERGFEPRSG
jgi:hypothetical protein